MGATRRMTRGWARALVHVEIIDMRREKCVCVFWSAHLFGHVRRHHGRSTRHGFIRASITCAIDSDQFMVEFGAHARNIVIITDFRRHASVCVCSLGSPATSQHCTTLPSWGRGWWWLWSFFGLAMSRHDWPDMLLSDKLAKEQIGSPMAQIPNIPLARCKRAMLGNDYSPCETHLNNPCPRSGTNVCAMPDGCELERTVVTSATSSTITDGRSQTLCRCCSTQNNVREVCRCTPSGASHQVNNCMPKEAS